MENAPLPPSIFRHQ